MTRVLVTGATGLIGRASVAALQASGAEVLALSRSGADVAGATGLACDLTDPDQTARALDAAGAERLLHLAWVTGAERWHGAANFDWICHSLRLVTQFADRGGVRVVASGSCAEYDWSEGTMSENTPLRPATAYGQAKAAAGMALCGAAKARDLPLAWARIFFVFGPGEPRGRLFGDLIHGLSAGESVACTDGAQRRDFLHVDDLGRALAMLALSDLSGPINLGHGTPLAVRDLILELAGQLGATDRVQLGARARPAHDPDLIGADVTRLRDELGFRPTLGWSDAVAKVLAEDLRR